MHKQIYDAVGMARRSSRITTWEEAEYACADWMRQNGWPTAVVTGRGADRGIDVVADGAVAQVKYHARPVGRPDVQRLAGAAPEWGAFGLLFSKNGFSRAAVEWAEAQGVGLYSFDDFGNVVSVVPLDVITVDISAREDEDPKVTRLDIEIAEMSALAGRVNDTLMLRSRQKLGLRDRSSMKRARKVVVSVAADLDAADRLYETGKWKAASRKVGRVAAAYRRAATILGI